MTTLLTLRTKVGKQVSAYKEFTTTTAGGSDFYTLISTEFADYEDDSLKNKYVKMTSGDTLETRRIEFNQSPTGTIKVYRPFTAQIATGKTVELYDFDPDDLVDCINDAIAAAYPVISKPVRDYSLVSGNLIVNGRFADWAVSTHPDYWTASVSALTQETSEIYFGDYSLKIVGAGYAYLSSDDWPLLLSLENSTQDFYVWAKASAAVAKLVIYTKTISGTETTSAGTGDALHSGGNEWEELKELNVSIPDDLAEIQIRLQVTGANTAYFSNAYTSGTVYDYVLPSRLDFVLQANECNDYDVPYLTDASTLDFFQTTKEGVKYIRFDNVSDGKTIELMGYGKYAALSSDTDTIDLSPKQEQAIVYGAIASLLRRHGTTISSQNIDEVLKLAATYETLFERNKTARAITPYHFRSSSL